jgi:AcrR family transcriptional regulator
MPRLLDDTVAQNRRKIEAAALKLFTRQGFHGTTVREIARKAGVSMGKLYLYYPNKEDIFVALVQRMEQQMVQLRQTEILPHMQSPDPDSLRELGMAVGKVVSENLDYWRLMYVDVVEFRHKHFLSSYREVAGGLRTFSTALFQKAPIPFPSDVNPGFAYVTLYLQFVTYFLVEELFGAKRHLGVSDAEAVDQFVRLYTRGRKDRPSRP